MFRTFMLTALLLAMAVGTVIAQQAPPATNPFSQPYYMHMVNIQLWSDAIKLIQQDSDAHKRPLSVSELVTLALCYRNLKQYDPALKYAQLAWQSQETADSAAELLRVMIARGDIQKARTMAIEILVKHPDFRYAVYEFTAEGASLSAIMLGETAPANAVWCDSLDFQTIRTNCRTRIGKGMSGSPMYVGGIRYRHGMGTHANIPYSELSLDLNNVATRFITKVGIDGHLDKGVLIEKGFPIAPFGAVVFEVYVDEKKVAFSPVMRPGMPGAWLDADLTGASHLSLRMIGCYGNIIDDHADWAGALIFCKPDTTVQLERSKELTQFNTLLSDSKKAYQDKRWNDMEHCLVQAEKMDTRTLTRHEYGDLALARRMQGRPKEALPIHLRLYWENCDIKSLSDVVADYLDTGQYTEACSIIVQWVKAGRPGEYDQAAWRDCESYIDRLAHEAISHQQYMVIQWLCNQLEGLHPQNEYECRSLVKVEHSLCRYQDAVPYAEHAMKLNPCARNAAMLCDAYRLAGHFDKARAFVKAYCVTDRFHAELKQAPTDIQVLQDLYRDLSTVIVRFDQEYDPHKFPSDIVSWVRKAGYWDVPVVVESPWVKSHITLSNAKSYTEVFSTAGDRHWRIVPQDIEKPVVVHVAVKEVHEFLDLDRATIPYVVPEKFRPYLNKTDSIDPTTPLALATAAPLKGKTIKETIENVVTWVTLNIADPTSGYPEDGPDIKALEGYPNSSEVALRSRMTACAGHTTVIAALLRANGLAARWGGGAFHAWPEVWIPPYGWVPLQNWVPVGFTDWYCVRMTLEGVDWSSHSPSMDYATTPCNLLYMGTYNGIFVNRSNWKLIAFSMNDISFEDALKADAKGQVLTDGLFGK